MKLIVMTCLVLGAMTVSANAGESTDCKNIVTDGSKTVDCDKLSGVAKTKCEADKAAAASPAKKQAS